MINLLPLQEKKELLERRAQNLIILWGILFSLFFISSIAGLLSIKFYLSGQNISQKAVSDLAKKELENQENQVIKKEILSLDKDISRISSFYQGNTPLTEILEKLVKNLPPDIYLKTFSYQKDSSSFTITGFSLTREDLLLFKNNLEKEKSFSEIFFPPSNWVKAKDIDFFVNLKISPKQEFL